ncbi:uncharacterized protein LOC115819471 [Chanos chanos]|uniref:Uncharacterized protein LOC115819471 n=1 Tax=Chanos chanos TaxID=29144 RepID=A0A6J2W3L4_CHACN|nr:uncharacterized protein LOC115819471 [Chanos chanos]
MERDARTPTSPVCTTPLCEPHPHVLPCSSSSSDDVGRKSCSRRTGHQRGDRERVQGQSRLSSGHVLPEPSEINTPAGPRETGSSTTSFADHTESQNPSFESTVDMGHKRKMPSPVTVSNLESMSRSLHKQTLSQSEIKRESPESPPPVKRWVIGPFFQSFRSKMASFTDIVMSPTRLFKPSDNPSLTVHPDPRRSDAEPTNGVLPQAGGGVQDMGGKGKEDPRTHLSITKKQPNTGTPNHREIAGKVKFDTNSNDHSGLEQERPRCGGQSPAKTPPLNQSVQFHSVLEENVEVNSCSSNQMLRKKGPLSSQLLNSESATCESSQPNKPGVFGSRQDWPLHRKQTKQDLENYLVNP